MNRNEALMLLIEEAHRGDFHFPSSARLAIRIKQTLDDPECHLEAAEKLIQAEPLLAAQVISLANSVIYNPSGREITDLRTAAARLGFQTLRTLSMALVTRQMSGTPNTPEQKKMAAELWQHTAHVAALCRVIAAKIDHKHADAAMFCGLVHEIGGFYLLARSDQYPALLADESAEPGQIDLVSAENTLTLAVLRNLGVPETVINAVERFTEGFLAAPLATTADALILADYMALVPSPLAAGHPDTSNALFDEAIESNQFDEMLEESTDEVGSLTRALHG